MGKGAKFEAVGTVAKVCKCCGAANATMKCAVCLTVYYCSPECQKKDWKEGGENRHKIQCAVLTKMRARYMEKAKNEIEEKIARFGIQDSGGGAGPSMRRMRIFYVDFVPGLQLLFTSAQVSFDSLMPQSAPARPVK